VTASIDTLQDLERQHPEWAPWLGVVQAVFDEIQKSDWDDAVPADLAWHKPGTPLLAGACLSLEPNAVSLLFDAVLSRAGFDPDVLPKNAGIQTAALNSELGRNDGALPILGVFEAALNNDDGRLSRLAARVYSDPERFHAVAALVLMPFLHACTRRWGMAAPENWAHGYCVVCGTWPAFAEECGVDRIRYLRCGRCGSAWQALRLLCPYCGMTEHAALASLVVGEGQSAIEVCKRCSGYVKVFTTLRPVASSQVLFEDLASVTLDLAATARGYRRPDKTGYRLNVRVDGSGELIARRH
jgi:FdhE protein